MTAPKSCQHETLAQTPMMHIQRCIDCGCVTIHLGPISVRMDDAGLEGLWAAVGEATAKLHERKQEQHRPMLRSLS
ncbi:MAG: hypothetical protein AAGF12_02995 [Myxococcota bacterium]